ncbi:MAG: PilZ domain-containing protein [Bdellovibrionales bacterium]|nr:PilZ domain-containing protein [Bdellovibrionales bacterium]
MRADNHNMDDRKYVKRRRVPRREYDGRVGLLYRGAYEVCRASQIGEGGMMLHTPTEMQVGDRVVLTFKPPGVEQTVVQSTVRFAMPEEDGPGFKYGLEFMNLEFQAKRQIRSFVASKKVADINISA